ncbi:hypothetical protein LCGC14_1235490 [marine sediment metagenome]|uniref:Uncharacterized protein n=1 Tax=marine sediment metagenome TaxID=412755 RepID=A0A0F9NPN3_9ZZZZ
MPELNMKNVLPLATVRSHIRTTGEGFTHWSNPPGGPGNLTLDPDCPRCQAEAQRDEDLRRMRPVLEVLLKWAQPIMPNKIACCRVCFHVVGASHMGWCPVPEIEKALVDLGVKVEP